MKNTIYTIIMIALIAVAAFLIISPSNSVAPVDNVEPVVQQDEVVEEVVEDSTYEYSVDLDKSEVNWVGTKKFLDGYEDKGTLSLLSGGLNLMTEGNVAEGEFVFDMDSIIATETGVGGGVNNLTRHLKSDDFFDVENHPTAKFVITDSDESSVSGDLTVKGITNPISMNVSWNDMDQFVTGVVSINRVDFGIDFLSEGLVGLAKDKIVADTFDLEFKVHYE